MSTNCWFISNKLLANGYNRLNGRLAHRYFYEQLVGPIPKGMVIDHLCGVRSCVNPDHLEPVTQAENLNRAPDAVATVNTEKTHCPKGHEYNIENTNLSCGRRKCRACHRAREANRRLVAKGVSV